MVSLQVIRESNSRIGTSLQPGFVAVFVGATSGIGEATLKEITKHTRRPRIYFLGRRESEGNRIKGELKKLNAEGEYHFLQYDVSLLKNVDEACRYIRDREPAINLLFLSSGTLTSGKQTDEGLHYPVALGYYSRTRFIVNLLPQLKHASSLRRVVTVLAGGKEGRIHTNDFQANNLGMLAARSHITSMATLALKSIAEQAPEVSFIHDFPGFVNTSIARELTGVGAVVGKVFLKPLMAIMSISADEASERHAYFATSAKFPPRGDERKDAEGVSRAENIDLAVGVDETPGSGVYSIDYDAEGTSKGVRKVLKGLLDDGTADKAWKHTEEEFMRITGSLTI